MTLKPLLGFSKMKDPDFLATLTAVHRGMNRNFNYPNPPIAMAEFEAGIASLSAAVEEAIDGGKIAIAEKKRQREAMNRKVVQLGHYAEYACNNDLFALTSSGFMVAGQPSDVMPSPPARIKKVEQGETGELLVSLKAFRTAYVYELRVIEPDLEPWTALTLTNSRRVAVTGLTPGKTYSFQARAFVRLGFTDWSEPVSRMCI
jgi:hypothetical protein